MEIFAWQLHAGLSECAISVLENGLHIAVAYTQDLGHGRPCLRWGCIWKDGED